MTVRSALSDREVTKPETEAAPIPYSKDWSEQKRVAIFDSPGRLTSLGAVLFNIGYRGVPATEADLQGEFDFDAAMLTDDLDPALASRIASRCPALISTADTSFANRLAIARAGVHAVLQSPIDVGELADWLDALIGQHQATPFNVLIVDDDELLAETHAIALEQSGMRVSFETDQESALARITAAFPDVVLMDLRMPGANGIELARIIRQSRRNLSLPVIFLSAEKDPGLQFEARRLGGDDFISKPIDPERLVSLVRMRAERARALRSLMERDSLTGLLNHGRLKERLSQELARCKRTGAEISLALLDLDHFKRVNDTYGHLNGDRVLRTLAHTLIAGLRRIDVIGRYGGEEFGIILLDTPVDASCTVVDSIRERFSQIDFKAMSRSFSVTFSAGIANSRFHESSEGLIAAADQALYRAKSEGRNRTVSE